MRTGFAFLISALCVVIALTPASSAGEIPASVMCHDIDEAAHDNLLPVGVLARLLWTESQFRADAVSPVGALGVAQFMPTTAEERGLTNPFAPERAAVLRDQRSNPDVAHTIESDLYRHFIHGLPLAFGIELMVQRRAS